MTSQTTLLGAAGEYYVMSQLLRRGLIAALAPVGVPNCDIIVSDEIGDRLSAIQVKTRQEKGTDGGWHMRKKHEDIVSPGLFYAFVDFGKSLDDHPACFLIPSKVVAEVIGQSHKVWLETPGKMGQQRNGSDLRRLLPDYDRLGIDIGRGEGWLEQYRNVWHNLQKPVTN
jgi:hypothetical protein